MIRKSKWQGWNAWTIPAFALTCVISLIPWCIMIYNSFFDTSYSNVSSGSFVGLDNYREAFSDSSFIISLWNTAKIMLIALPLEFIIGLVLALIVWKHLKMRKFVVPILIIPMIISPSVVGLIWNLNLNPVFGPVGIWLREAGLSPDGLLSNIKTALAAITMIDVWQWTPLVMLITLAGLVSLSSDFYEAAQIDGATAWQVFWGITLPLIRPTVVAAAMLRFMDSVKTFDQIYVTTQGGPGIASQTLNLYVFDQAFQYLHFGYASALLVVLFFVILAGNLVLVSVRRGQA